MSNTISFKLPWQKAYEEWAKDAPRDTDMDAMFRSGYIYGQRDKEEEIARRVAEWIRSRG